MIQSIKLLIEALRDELQNYGEMLALLERQREYLITRAASEVFQSISLIKAQGAAIQQARERREECRRAVAEDCTMPEEAPFASLIPILPADYQPLLMALVEENNELLYRVRRRARQNHVMLRRSVELMQDLLNTLMPSRQTTVYDELGACRSVIATPHRLYEAVG
ncbi:MAG TPA: flagellar export chaperone FlgN [Verrucomicrobiae bacterium]|jgi:flagellar biosynthesis/type III secretory pathway chaperone|nr:flagellar export chaperone FlgN [Verrucomicrobiae bacterium]